MAATAAAAVLAGASSDSGSSGSSFSFSAAGQAGGRRVAHYCTVGTIIPRAYSTGSFAIASSAQIIIASL